MSEDSVEKIADIFYASLRSRVDERSSESVYRKRFIEKAGVIFNKENQIYTLNGIQISLEAVLFGDESILINFIKPTQGGGDE